MCILIQQVKAGVPSHLSEEPLIFLGHPISVNVAEMDKLPPTADSDIANSGGLWSQFVRESEGCYGLQVGPHFVAE